MSRKFLYKNACFKGLIIIIINPQWCKQCLIIFILILLINQYAVRNLYFFYFEQNLYQFAQLFNALSIYHSWPFGCLDNFIKISRSRTALHWFTFIKNRRCAMWGNRLSVIDSTARKIERLSLLFWIDRNDPQRTSTKSTSAITKITTAKTCTEQ